MSHTIFEKIVLSHCNEKQIQAGDIVEVTVDKMMVHDFFVPFFINKFLEMGFKKLLHPDDLVFIYDHLVPASFIGDYRHHKMGDDFSREYSVKHVHRSDGICHQLMHEQGYVKPGSIVLGTDSHTVTYGAIGAFATGIGYTEMAAIAGTGKTWLKVAPTIKVNVDGNLKKGVFSKDIILKLLGDIKSDGASYKILEFSGACISDLTVDSRLTLCNMVVEGGAKAGIIAPDKKAAAYLGKFWQASELDMLSSDKDAVYESEIDYDAGEIVPLVACPYNVDIVKKAEELNSVTIDEVFIGSCTNGRLEDLEAAAKILDGKKINPNVRCIVVPASRKVYNEALDKGYLSTLIKAGAILGHPACSLCAGRSGGILENGERVISTNNRNFIGRMGGEKVEIYLASPATAAASAIQGRITDPREFMK